MRMDHLVVLAPYVDDGAFADSAFRNSWERALTLAESTIVVRTAAAAEAVLRFTHSRQPSCDLRINSKLHAKVLIAWRSGVGIAAVGSHNLTGAALHTNEEVGILIKPVTVGLRGIVMQLRTASAVIVRNSLKYAMHPSHAGRNPSVTANRNSLENRFELQSRRNSIA